MSINRIPLEQIIDQQNLVSKIFVFIIIIPSGIKFGISGSFLRFRPSLFGGGVFGRESSSPLATGVESLKPIKGSESLLSSEDELLVIFSLSHDGRCDSKSGGLSSHGVISQTKLQQKTMVIEKII